MGEAKVIQFGRKRKFVFDQDPAQGIISGREFYMIGLQQEDALDINTRELALKNYFQCIELEPDHAKCNLALGRMFFKRKIYTEAEYYLNRSIQSDWHDPEVYLWLGNVFRVTGKRDDALVNYKHALSLRPGYPQACYNLAELFQEMNEPIKAMLYWKAYLKSAEGYKDQLDFVYTHAAARYVILRANSGFKIVPKKD